MHDARNNSGHMHDAQALAMHDARNEKNAMHVHTICKNPMIGARKKAWVPSYIYYHSFCDSFGRCPLVVTVLGVVLLLFS